MIEELPSPRLACRFTHELVRRALYDRLSRAAAGRAPPPRRRGARERRRGAPAARSRTSRTTSPPPRPFGGAERAVEYNLRAARRRQRGARLRRGGGAAAHRARARDRGRAASAPRSCSSSARPATGPARRPTRWRRSRGGRDRARAGQRRAARPGRDRLRGGLLAPGDRRQGAVELLEEALAALGEEDSRAAGRAAGRPRPRARLPGRARARGDRARRARSRWRGSSSDRAGLATVLVRSYWSRGTTPARGDPGDADRGEGARRGAGRHRDPGRGDGLAGADLRRPRRSRVRPAARSPLCARWPSRRRSRSCSTLPSTTARRIALCDGRLGGGRGNGGTLARLGPAADRT